MKRLRVLYVGMQYDYGEPARGPSYEEVNFADSLRRIHEVTSFDFMARMREVGRRAMRRDLIRLAGETKPDVVFFTLFTNEIDGDTIRQVGKAAQAPTVNWFADDHWRFHEYSSHYAKYLDWYVTTDPDAVERYERLGLGSVILSQWACNQHLYAPTGRLINDYAESVTFVGARYGDRPVAIRAVESLSVPVACWGKGWPNGRLEFPDMIDVFSSSAISLNLASSYRPSLASSVVLTLTGRGGSRQTRSAQIKGRVFEIAGCGGFQLTQAVPHLGDYFALDDELVAFSNLDDLVEKVQIWIREPDQRRAVAESARQRVLAEHTYEQRFQRIFSSMGVEPR